MHLEETRPFRAYADDHDHRPPLGVYLGFMALYGLGGLAALSALRRSGRTPGRIPLGDLALLGVATHKLSRLITRAKVTAPVRAPFTHLEGASSMGEVNEKPRGGPVRRAVGSLLSCPFCLDPWVAGGLTLAYALRPDEARLAAATLTMVTTGDFLHRAYRLVDSKAREALADAHLAEEAHLAPPAPPPPPRLRHHPS